MPVRPRVPSLMNPTERGEDSVRIWNLRLGMWRPACAKLHIIHRSIPQGDLDVPGVIVLSPPYGSTEGNVAPPPSYSIIGTQPVFAPSVPTTAGGIAYILAIIGIILLLVGTIVGATVITASHDENDIYLASTILIAIGAAILAIGLLHGVLRGTELGDNVRMGMAIALGLVIAFALSGTNSLLSFFRFF